MAQKRALLIDNQPNLQQWLSQKILEPEGYRLIVVSNGKEGLEQALKEQFSLIILDTDLPDASGIEVLRTLQRHNVEAPIIVTSPSDSAQLAVEAFRAGACDYVNKPLTGSSMRQAISRALASGQSQKEQKQLSRQLHEVNQRLQRQLQELNAIHVIGRLSTSLTEMDNVLDRIVELSVYMTSAEEGMLFLLDDKQDELHLRAAKNVSADAVRNCRLHTGSEAVARAIETDRPVLLTGEQARIPPSYDAEAILYIPLRAPDRSIVGVLVLANRDPETAFSERDIHLLLTLVGYATIAIENARLFENISSAKALRDNVFASINSGVITINNQDRIMLFNRAAGDILRVPTASMIGEKLPDALPALESKIDSMISQTRELSRPTGPFEIDLTIPERGARHLRVRLSPLQDTSGRTEGIAIVMDDLTEQRRLETRYQLFQRYLSPAVIERLPNDPYELKLGGSRQEITCLFADLRGFTDFSLHHTPETLMEVLNQYLDIGANAILAEEGTLDKFMGDSVLAFFNAPLSQDDHTLRAIRAAVRINEGVNELHERLTPSYRLAYGMGISVGEAVVGNVGTPRRLDYTAIGPSVNLARRLQEVADPNQILIASEAYEHIQDVVKARPLPPIQLRGFSKPITVYELLELK